MKIWQFFKRALAFSAFFSLLFNIAHGIDLKTITNYLMPSDKAPGLTFFSDISSRKRQLEELESKKEFFEKQVEEDNKGIAGKLQSIITEENDTKEKLSKSENNGKELFEKKLSILNDRKQGMIRLQELWKEIESITDKHVKLTKQFIEELSGKVKEKDVRFIYLWKHLEEAKGKIDDFSNKITSETAKKDALQKELSAEKENINALKKQVDLQIAENEKLLNQLSTISEQPEQSLEESLPELKINAGLGEQQLYYLREKVDYFEQKVKKLSLEIKYQEDELEFFKYKRSKYDESLVRIQQNLVLDPSDVARANTEVEKAIKLNDEEKNKLSKVRETTKKKQTEFSKQLSELEKKLTELGEANKNESIDYYIADARYQKFSSDILILKKEVDRLDIDQALSNVLVDIKKLKAQVVNVLHKINIGVDNVDEWLNDFKNQKRAIEHTKKILKDKRDAAINELTKISADIETLELKKKDLKQKKNTVFKDNVKQLYDVLNTLKQSVGVLESYRPIIEKYFSRASELIFRQEEIVNQLDFVINYLDSRKRTDNIWKRSARAISLDGFIKSVYDAEDFFKDFFWDTPQHITPVALIFVIKQANFSDLFGISVIIALFILLFLFFRMFLVYFSKKMRNVVDKERNKTYSILDKILSNLFEFILDRYGLIFSWIFIYINISAKPKYFGLFVQDIVNPYFASLFYLISIPIFIYLTLDFLKRLKKLNQEMRFILFSEDTQNKFLGLIGIVLYSSAILLPLRHSFLSYRLIESAFPKVLLAAYSLIVVIVILLFFTKEDVLKLVSTQNSFFIWLRKKIEKYYYPVFVFCVGLLILSNPYIGYLNLAWYLAFAVPAAAFLINGLFFIHYYIRKYSLSLFVKEENEESISRFEHAKAYYGFFIIATFIFLALLTLVLLARIWGFEGYSLGSLWKSLSEEWVIRISDTDFSKKLGFVEFLKVVLFVVGGFISSSAIDKFVLGRLFDIFQPEPGMQNTISRILHYIIIFISAVLGLTAINLAQYATLVLTGLLLGLGFGLKDQIADFFAGFLILIERPLEIGHFVQTEEIRGVVKKISARATTIKTARNFSVIIPNRDLISKPIINWGQGRNAVAFELEMTVAYQVHPEEVKNILREVVQKHPLVLRVPSIVIRVNNFGENGILFFVRAFVSARRVTDMWDVESDLRFAILKSFRENEVVIPYPQQVLHFADQKKSNPIKIKFNEDEKHPKLKDKKVADIKSGIFPKTD